MAKNYINSEKTFCVRKALAEKAENGNTSFIHEDDIKNHGGNKNVWRTYDTLLTEMEAIAREFVKYFYMTIGGKDSAEIDKKYLKRDERLKDINSRLIDKKKELLTWVDPDQKHRCTDFDGVLIGEMAHKIQRMKNNVDRVDGFKSKVAHTYAERRTFRHRLEAELGILITGVDVMDPEHAHYLRVENKLLGKISSAEREKKELTDKRAGFIGFVVEFGISDEEKEKKLASYDEQISEIDNKIEEAEKQLAQFRREHKDERAYEPTIQEEMGAAKKEEDLSAILEKVKAMTEEQKLEVMKLFGMKSRKSEKVEDLNKRLAETIMSAKDVINKPADEPEKAVAEAK